MPTELESAILAWRTYMGPGLFLCEWEDVPLPVREFWLREVRRDGRRVLVTRDSDSLAEGYQGVVLPEGGPEVHAEDSVPVLPRAAQSSIW